MIYYLIAFLAGILQVVNRMTNVKATQVFGSVNGPLINFIEATFLSLFLLYVTGQGGELAAAHILSVPWWAYLCSITGLIALLLQTFGAMRTNAVIASVLLMIGNFAMAIVLDYLFYEKFSIVKTLGIGLIWLGAAWIDRQKYASSADEGNSASAH